MLPLAIVSVMFTTVSCGKSTSAFAGENVLTQQLVELPALAANMGWLGIFKPVMIRVGADGAVWIADNDDGKVHVFDSTGVALRELGGPDRGIAFITDFAVLEESVIVLDSSRHLTRLSLSGAPLNVAQSSGYEQTLASFGHDKVIMASSAQWTAKVPKGRGSWPLARITSARGDSLRELGRADWIENRYVSHINNFVLPSGSPGGEVLWLAYLNSPKVIAYFEHDTSSYQTERPIPFDWKRMPATFVPTAGVRRPPFDGISYSIASDSAGNAYVLTALASRNARNEPGAMSVDVIAPRGVRPLRRLIFDGNATHVAVSAHGNRIYLLDTHRGTVRMFANVQ
jgi:DNA-binding beta-propeller fold protein YncE